jgi:hypothetical protein
MPTPLGDITVSVEGDTVDVDVPEAMRANVILPPAIAKI